MSTTPSIDFTKASSSTASELLDLLYDGDVPTRSILLYRVYARTSTTRAIRSKLISLLGGTSLPSTLPPSVNWQSTHRIMGPVRYECSCGRCSACTIGVRPESKSLNSTYLAEGLKSYEISFQAQLSEWSKTCNETGWDRVEAVEKQAKRIAKTVQKEKTEHRPVLFCVAESEQDYNAVMRSTTWSEIGDTASEYRSSTNHRRTRR
jgi:hypothetical protein